MTALTVFLLAILAALVCARVEPPRFLERAGNMLRSRWAPLALGAAASAIMAWVWGDSLRQVAVVHDEASYLLQAKIYAALRWTAPGLPLPEFFEQYHVFVTPLLFSKYPPGHAIAMVPGIWLGLPGLVPIIEIGLTAALIFSIARRVANAWIALLTWLLWVAAPGVLWFMPSYLSETTSCVLWLLGWWVLLRWREDNGRRWLLLLAGCIGWGVLTRPLTWALYAIPVALIVVPPLLRRRAWRDLALATAVGGLCVALMALWCIRTTGHPLQTPYSLYSQVYFPDDVMGFGLTSQPAQRELNADMARFNDWVRTVHGRHTVAALPTTLAQRMEAVGLDMWRDGAKGLLPFVPLALIAAPELAIAFGFAGLLLLGYLTFGHPPQWTVYYLEIQPVLAFATAFGVWRFFIWTSRFLAPGPWSRAPASEARGALATVLVLLLLALPSVNTVSSVRGQKANRTAYHRAFRDAVASLPGNRVVVFVRYAPNHNHHNSLIANEPDLSSARAWIVYDRGSENDRLLRLAPDRVAYLFDEAAGTIWPVEAHPDHAQP